MVSPISLPAGPDRTTAIFLLGSGVGSAGRAPEYAGGWKGSTGPPISLYQKLTVPAPAGTSRIALRYAVTRNSLRQGMRRVRLLTSLACTCSWAAPP